MPGLSADQIRAVVGRFIPVSLQENIFVKSLLAGAAAIAVLLATPAFAPVGVVGATGWIIVYVVTGGTFTYEVVKAAWNRWKHMTPEQRVDLDTKMEMLKKARDSGALTDEEFKRKARVLLNDVVGSADD